MKEIRVLQKNIDLLIPHSTFGRLACEVTEECTSKLSFGMKRFQKYALEALQHAAEMHLVQKFEKAQMCAIHCRWVTVLPRDLALVKEIEKP